jgi:peptide/nickel transport system substrate-binding protein
MTTMRFATACLAAAMALAAPVAQGAGLRIGLQSDPDALDPATGTSFTGRIVFAALCDKLVDIDPRMEVVPQLATAWSWSADGLALTMTLRDGVVFHDGERFDAAAARENLERYRTAPLSRRKAELKAVSAVEAPDPRTLVLRLSEPFAPLLSVLADRAGMMMSPKAVAAAGERVGANPACSGPFRLARRVPLERIVLERFDRYWDPGAIHVDGIEFMMIPDNTVRLVNLRAGQLDLIERVPPADLKTVRADARLRLASTTGLAYQTMIINVGNGEKARGPLGRRHASATRSSSRSTGGSSTRSRSRAPTRPATSPRCRARATTTRRAPCRSATSRAPGRCCARRAWSACPSRCAW